MAMTGFYHTLIRPRVHRPLSMLKYDPVGKFGLSVLSWLEGVAVLDGMGGGLTILATERWLPSAQRTIIRSSGLLVREEEHT